MIRGKSCRLYAYIVTSLTCCSCRESIVSRAANWFVGKSCSSSIFHEWNKEGGLPQPNVCGIGEIGEIGWKIIYYSHWLVDTFGHYQDWNVKTGQPIMAAVLHFWPVLALLMVELGTNAHSPFVVKVLGEDMNSFLLPQLRAKQGLIGYRSSFFRAKCGQKLYVQRQKLCAHFYSFAAVTCFRSTTLR